MARRRQAGKGLWRDITTNEKDSKGSAYRHSMRHGASKPRQEATSYTLRNGVVIRLLAESFSPYWATVRIEQP